jgi:hypothetical protein
MLTKSFPLTLFYIPTDKNDGIRRSVAGVILHETKRTKGWNNGWAAKLKGDMLTVGAHLGVIVSETLQATRVA